MSGPINVMARWAIRNAYEAWAEQGHENTPDIGLYDYERMCEAAEKMLPPDVTMDEFTEAFDVLVARVDTAVGEETP